MKDKLEKETKELEKKNVNEKEVDEIRVDKTEDEIEIKQSIQEKREDKNPEEDLLKCEESSSCSFESDILEDEGFDIGERQLENEYSTVKKIMRKKRRKQALQCLLVVLLAFGAYLLYNRLTVESVMVGEIDDVDYAIQFEMNRKIENELHEPETRLLEATIQPKKFLGFLAVDRYRIQWAEEDTLGFRRDYYETDYYKNKLKFQGSTFEVRDLIRGLGGANYPDEVFEYFHNQRLILSKMTDLQELWDEKELDQIKDHSQLGVYLKFTEDLPLEEILEMDNAFKAQDIAMGLQWVSVLYPDYSKPEFNYNYNLDYIGRYSALHSTFGFDIFQKNRVDGLTHFDEAKYPYLDFSENQVNASEKDMSHPATTYEEVSAEMYEQHMISMLQYLHDQPSYIKHLSDDRGLHQRMYLTIIEDIETDGIQSDVVYVTLSKENLVEVLKDERIASAFISQQK